MKNLKLYIYAIILSVAILFVSLKLFVTTGSDKVYDNIVLEKDLSDNNSQDVEFNEAIMLINTSKEEIIGIYTSYNKDAISNAKQHLLNIDINEDNEVKMKYYIGVCDFLLGNYSKSKALFEEIPLNSPYKSNADTLITMINKILK